MSRRDNSMRLGFGWLFIIFGLLMFPCSAIVWHRDLFAAIFVLPVGVLLIVLGRACLKDRS